MMKVEQRLKVLGDWGVKGTSLDRKVKDGFSEGPWAELRQQTPRGQQPVLRKQNLGDKSTESCPLNILTRKVMTCWEAMRYKCKVLQIANNFCSIRRAIPAIFHTHSVACPRLFLERAEGESAHVVGGSEMVYSTGNVYRMLPSY